MLTNTLHKLSPRAQLAAFGTLVLAVALVVWFLTRINTVADQRVGTTGVAPSLPAVDPAQSEAHALAQARCDRAWILAAGAQTALNGLQEAIEQWTVVEALRSNQDGRLLASNPQAVAAFNALYQRPRPTTEEAGAWEQSLNALVVPLEGARKAPGLMYSPSDEQFRELEQQRDKLRAALRELQEQQESVAALLATARRQNQPAPITLEEAMNRLREARAQESADYLSERERARQREADKTLADAEDERQRRLTEATNQARDSETAQKGLEIKARRDDIKKKYKPFLELGKFKPLRNASPIRTDTALPMSYADLKAFGVFNDYKTFAKAGGGMWGSYLRQENDRPTWPCPRREEDFDQYKELFREFCELAPIWAKDGTLAP